MKHCNFESKSITVIHLDEGEDLLNSLRSYAKTPDFEDAIIISCIGTLKKARVHMITDCNFPPNEYISEQTGAIEVLALQGYIADGEVHAHITISDQNMAIGGHLEEGTIVLHMCEIALQVLGGEKKLRRIKDPKRNMIMLQFETRKDDY